MTELYREAADATGLLRPIVAQVMDIQDVTLGRSEKYAVRFRGTLKIDSITAYDQVAAAFRPHHFTPLFRLQNGQHIILAMPGVIDVRPTNPWINVGLFVLTLFSAFYTGAAYAYDGPCTDVARALIEPLFNIWTGWPFALSMLGILLAHEFGHYIAARLRGEHVTLPYFLPLPAPLSPFGTLGAVIVMRSPVRNRRSLLDIGIAGPLAGFIVAIPVVLIGLRLSQLGTIAPPPPGCGVSLEGNSIVYLLAKYVTFGRLLPAPEAYGAGGPVLYWLRYFFTGTPLPIGGQDVFLHPVAWAGWAGLFVTGLNLIPVGQLDGGHTLYVLLGRRVRWLLPVVLGTLAVLGLFWYGWWLWVALIYTLNRRPAELLDEITPLDPGRRALAILTLAIFFLVFTPIPLGVVGS